ncbi:capsular biosynthesis protein [Burkholderia ubonensis]|nr:capsular biosynthesis protein [Burkholderia ubonensis]KVU16577.1 capsular biosynthesis protein [Burkholderia ubonensis]
MAMAAACGLRPRIAWRGPLDRARQHTLPWLSWFEHDITEGTVPGSFIAALNRTFDVGTSDFPPDIDDLINRVYATWIPAGSADGPQNMSPATQVVILDERRWPHDPTYDSPVSRPEAFERMVAAASRNHPAAKLWLVRSADRGSGRWLSESAAGVLADVRIHRIADPTGLRLSRMSHVYTIGATEGLLALLGGTHVHVFGGPYYAGWGLTVDYFSLCARLHRPTVRQLFHAVFLRLARYLDPHTHESGDIRSVLASLELQRDIAARYSDMRHLAAIHIKRWKRPFVTPFLTAGGGTLRWTNRHESLSASEQVVLWGARDLAVPPRTAGYVRIEDGFLHSLGLGSDIIAPYSQVVDTRGIYFDPRTRSDLTDILNHVSFDDAELTRAAMLREQIVRHGLTKYNLGRRRPLWSAPPGRKVVLVAGQVEDDASIRLGCPEIRTARALLREVRARRPHALLVYRPHPDVLTRNRRGLIDASAIADVVDTQADIVSLIEAADEVHTLTSLVGFDALLRGKPVFTYGVPFYAGWGLTHDAITTIPHRERSLSLDMLTAGALLRYPVYWDWRLRLFTTPETVVDRLAHRAFRPLTRVRWSPLRLANRTRRWAWNTCTYFWACRSRLVDALLSLHT